MELRRVRPGFLFPLVRRWHRLRKRFAKRTRPAQMTTAEANEALQPDTPASAAGASAPDNRAGTRPESKVQVEATTTDSI